MASYFFDTSAFVKYYHDEVGSQQIISLIDQTVNHIFISRLTLVEWHSAFALKVRSGSLTLDNFQIAKRSFYSDLRIRKFAVVSLERIHQQSAIRLLKKYAFSQNLRTLDALQLAVALEFHKQASLDYFVCADVPFCQIARQEGISVLNPEVD